MSERVGLWIIGARGGVASVVAAGLVALQKNLTEHTGLTSSLPEFRDIGLVDWNSIVLGGHEIRSTNLLDAVRNFQQSSRSFDGQLIDQIEEEISKIDERIRPGILAHAGPAISALAPDQIANDSRLPRQKIKQIQDDLRQFVDSNNLQRVIAVNISSTETPIDSHSIPKSWAELEKTLDQAVCVLPASSLYAIAALDMGIGFINFTPSLGASCPAIEQLAIARGAVHAGRDGKTGETLIKSVLAPAFAIRNLEIMSWVGHNIFGNLDGQILDDPANKESKIASKDQLLSHILGYAPQTHISIEYIRSLGDWKTAWDHIHFRGFLGTPMVMQFTWQGCDSILAAPLVLDLFRFAERAQRAGESGNLDWLACFFKSPNGSTENNLTRQFDQLVEWAAGIARQ